MSTKNGKIDNRFQEAFNDIIYHLPYSKQRAYHKQIDTLQELVDKETLKEVAKEVEERETYYEVSYECPTCKENLNFEKYSKRCPNCGQLLDWSKDE